MSYLSTSSRQKLSKSHFQARDLYVSQDGIYDPPRGIGHISIRPLRQRMSLWPVSKAENILQPMWLHGPQFINDWERTQVNPILFGADS